MGNLESAARWLAIAVLTAAVFTACDTHDNAATTPPLGQVSLVVAFPPADALLTGDGVEVAGSSANRAGIARILVNGEPATSTDGFRTWRAEVPLTASTRELVVQPIDAIGRDLTCDVRWRHEPSRANAWPQRRLASEHPFDERVVAAAETADRATPGNEHGSPHRPPPGSDGAESAGNCAAPDSMSRVSACVSTCSR